MLGVGGGREGGRQLAIFVSKASWCLKEASVWEHWAQKSHLLNFVHVWTCHPHMEETVPDEGAPDEPQCRPPSQCLSAHTMNMLAMMWNPPYCMTHRTPGRSLKHF